MHFIKNKNKIESNNIEKLFLFRFFIFFLFLPLSVTALAPGVTDPINVELTPTVPGPNQEVRVKIESYSTDLNSADILWVLNGKVVGDTKGQKDFTFKTGPLGSETKLNISVRGAGVGVVDKEIIIRPSRVDLVVESFGYTPPLYKGRSLYTKGSTIKVSAIPFLLDRRGKQYDKKDLVYTWSKNGTVLGNLSGYGRDSLITEDSGYIASDNNIRVEVKNRDGDTYAQNFIGIVPSEPKIVFYKIDPLQGTQYTNSLGSKVDLLSGQLAILAEPYFINKNDISNGNVTFKWYMNSDDFPSDKLKTNKIFVEKPEGVSGTTMLNLLIQNERKVLEGARKSITVDFISEEEKIDNILNQY